MDAHLVGYGSSSDEEGKPKKQQPQMSSAGKERNFRKREMSPEGGSNTTSPNKDLRADDLKYLSKPQNETEKTTNSNEESSSVNARKSRSPSPSRRANRSPEKSPEKRQKNQDGKNRSRSRSSSTSDKESRSAVDEFGRRIRRQQSDKSKDEDKSGSKDRRRYSRDERKSTSRSRSRERDRNRDRGGYRRYDRTRDDRYKDRDNRRRYSDRGADRSRERSRDHSPDRRRNRSPDRSRNRSPDRPRNRSRERSRDRDRSRERIDRRSTVKEKAIMSSEEIEKKLAARAQSLKQVVQEKANNLNLPSYLNPAVVNPQLYAKQQEKRKLLWSSKKTEQAPSNSKMWSGTKFAGDQGGEVQAKFRRLMGIKEGETAGDTTGEEGGSTGEKILTDLEKEFERSRAFQLSRGAGGKSGIGLGYAPPNYN